MGTSDLHATDFFFEQDPADFTPVGSYYNSKRLHDDEIRMFSKILDDIVRDGTLARLYERYIPKSYVEKSFVSSPSP